jgi:hypothetical protein
MEADWKLLSVETNDDFVRLRCAARKALCV